MRNCKISLVINSFLLICIGIFSMQCSSDNGTDTPPADLTAATEELIESSNAFGFKLFNEMVTEQPDSTIIISPLSVSMALGMTYNGAAGTTRDSMHVALEYGDLTVEEVNAVYRNLIDDLTSLDPDVEFQLANSIWCKDGFPIYDDFLNVNRDYFDAEVSNIDFSDPDAAAEIINSWVSENTNGKIEDLISPEAITIETAMFLINAIYFMGTWTYQFEETLTVEGIFHLPDGSDEPCSLMTQVSNFQYLNTDDFQAVNLPYGNEDFAMAIFLPYTHIDIDDVIAEFNPENWDEWIASFYEDSGEIAIPKFTIEYGRVLNDALKALGMEIAFDGCIADFSNMSSIPLWIDEVRHKTFIEVNEQGTEAAAATSVEMGYTTEFVNMWVTHPFIFIIYEKTTNTILFIGKITDLTP